MPDTRAKTRYLAGSCQSQTTLLLIRGDGASYFQFMEVIGGWQRPYNSPLIFEQRRRGGTSQEATLACLASIEAEGASWRSHKFAAINACIDQHRQRQNRSAVLPPRSTISPSCGVARCGKSIRMVSPVEYLPVSMASARHGGSSTSY